MRGEGGEVPPVRSEVGEEFSHLIGIDSGVIPGNPITRSTQHPTDLTLGHAANKLIPWGLGAVAELNASLSGVVEKLIVADPESSIPGFVV